MLSRYSLNFVRRLRNPTKRSGTSKLKDDSDRMITSLSESDMQNLMIRKNAMDTSEMYLDPCSDPPVIDITKHPRKREDSLLAGEKPKKRTITDMALQHPLTSALTLENQFERLAEAVTPLCKIPYQKQLKMKQWHAENILRVLRKKLKEVEAPITTMKGQLPCPVENIIPAPDLVKYRNKDEFSIHRGVDGCLKTVGHFVGLPMDPLMRCISSSHLINIKDSHKLITEHFQKFILDSKYKTCLKFDEGGVWRTIRVRSNLNGELMLVVIIFPSELTIEEKEDLKRSLHHYFFLGPGSECGLSSLYLQACSQSKCTKEMAPFELIGGQTHIVESCLGRSFQISPDSFFQTNTRSAELLYDSVKKIAELSSLSTLLDVCCGTGTISILLAPHCRGTIGIDASSSSIEDARFNAKSNGVHNANFLCGKIEKTLPHLTNELADSADVVAVVNPARGGLHSSVIETIRGCESIKKLIFVTCKPEGNALMNMAMLGSTLTPPRKKWLGKGDLINQSQKRKLHLTDPFTLRYAIPLDLFPHTLHIEYVLLFERVSR